MGFFPSIIPSVATQSGRSCFSSITGAGGCCVESNEYIPDVATWVLWVPSRRYSLSGWCDSRFFFDNSGLWPRCQDGITQGRMCDGVIVKFFSQGWARGRQTFCCLASCWIHRISKCRNTGREYMWLVFIVGTREFQSNRLQLCPS